MSSPPLSPDVIASSASLSRTSRFFQETSDRRAVAEDRFAFENTINYDAMPDGRLVVLVPVDEGLQLDVIVKWAEELAKRTSPSSTAR
jgi:hypothetical protein